MRHIRPLYTKSNPGADFIEGFLEKPAFEADVDAIRTKWNIDVANEIHLRDHTSSDRDRISKNKQFIADLEILQKKFQLGEEWSVFLEEYIFIDLLAYPKASNLFIEKRTKEDGDLITGMPTFYLRIFPETTQEDIAAAWGDIIKFIHGGVSKRTRRKPSKKIRRDRKIFNLAKLGFFIEDIQKFFVDRGDKNLSFDQIISSESRYRKKLGIKEGNKLRYRKIAKYPTALQELGSLWPDN